MGEVTKANLEVNRIASLHTEMEVLKGNAVQKLRPTNHYDTPGIGLERVLSCHDWT